MEKWIDRYLYTLDHPDVLKWDNPCMVLCTLYVYIFLIT